MQNTVNVPIKKLSTDAKVPSYAYSGDAGVDLCSTQALKLMPGQRALVPTSLAIALPQGYAGFVMPRSGLAVKHGISIVNAPGLIDSNYRGELKVCLVNLDRENAFTINVGDRIAQLVVLPVPAISFCEVEELDSTTRGSGGFGSSGVASS